MLFALFALAPIGSIFLAALETDTQAPGGFANFVAAWEIGRFGTYLRNSAMVSVFVVSISTVLSILAGYALGTMRFRGSCMYRRHWSAAIPCSGHRGRNR